MTTTNENTLNDDLNNQNQGGGSNSFGTPDAGDTTNRNFSDDADDDSGVDRNSLSGGDSSGNIPGSYSSNESFSGANSSGDDLAIGEDIDGDEELIDTENDPEDDDFEEAELEGDEELDTEDETATTTGAYGTDGDDLGTDNPNEIPEQGQSGHEGTGYDNQTEVERQQGGSDTSWSEQTDVTPPNQHGFPDAAGSPKTDFVSRPHGRTTGRMVGHEPGTEGI